MLWEQLDAQYNRLKELHEDGGVTAKNVGTVSAEHAIAYLQQQGKVQGLCFAVGTIMYPYDAPKDRIERLQAGAAAQERRLQRGREDDDDGDDELRAALAAEDAGDEGAGQHIRCQRSRAAASLQAVRHDQVSGEIDPDAPVVEGEAQ
ncbi:MAG: hypothetical protein IPK85_02810 [Gemmatimonadetes bacterium]|nr:hypothetical protein [Gemmatimonadota bacterium]